MEENDSLGDLNVNFDDLDDSMDRPIEDDPFAGFSAKSNDEDSLEASDIDKLPKRKSKNSEKNIAKKTDKALLTQIDAIKKDD